MAVSGRNFQGSFSRGSAEDFEHSCDPCLTEGQHVEASGYCTYCYEYLCINCFRYHKKTKALRNHQLLDKDNMHKHSALPKLTGICTEKCSKHRNEVIKYFCPIHEELGCTDCITMNHTTCNLDYIPEKCAGIGESNEFRDIVNQLDQKLTEADAVMEKVSVKERDIDESHHRAIKDFVKFRKEINDHLDTIQKKIEIKAAMRVATCKQELKAVIISCKKVCSNIKRLNSILQNSKASNQNGQLFTDIKRAKSELRSGEIQQAAASSEKTFTKFTFTRNKDLEHILTVGIFGNLTGKTEAVGDPSRSLQLLAVASEEPSRTMQSLDVTSRRKERTGMLSSLQHKTCIDLGPDCIVTCCVVLSSGKLVLADNFGSRLMVVNTKNNVIIEKVKLDSEPWESALLPKDQIAVTIPHQQQILIMTTARKLSTDHSITIEEVCYGIIHHLNCFYVLCRHEHSIHVLDMKGNIKNTISLDEAIFDSPEHMVLSQDHSSLYISTWNNRSIVSVTLQGEVSAVYKHEDLDGPRGMLVLADGSLLVCCLNTSYIYHVTADLEQGRTILEGLVRPQSICFSADRSKVYIGSGFRCDKLAVCSVAYKK